MKLITATNLEKGHILQSGSGKTVKIEKVVRSVNPLFKTTEISIFTNGRVVDKFAGHAMVSVLN